MKKFLLFSMMLLFVFILTSCSNGITHTLDPNHSELAYINDYEQLKALIDKQTIYQSRIFPEVMMEDAVSTTSAQKDYSTTNVQVSGIDEGDIIKTDGNRIYMITYDKLVVVDVTTPTMEVLLSKTLDSTSNEQSYTYYQELYVTDKNLIVVGQRYSYYLQTKTGNELTNEFIDIEPWYYYGLPETIIEIYDLNSLELSDTITVSGYLSSSRLIESHLYVLSRQDIIIYDDIDPRPLVSHNGNTTVQPYEDIQYIPSITNLENYTNILFINLDSTITFDLKTYLGQGYWGHTYVTFDGIYFAGNTYQYNETNNTYESIGVLMRYQILEDGDITFGGYQTYKGNILNQFAIDQYEQTIRLVTTDGWGENVINRLYIFSLTLNDNDEPVLSLLSLLDEGIGKPRESVQSVRFNGDIVTVVTFERTDPLYIIDLSDPNEPVITSELEITGYATYQHPWKDNTLLNIGYETDIDGRNIGIKLALFDTSDINNLTQIGSELTFLNGQNGWQYSEALHNHKALLFSNTHDVFGFSISRSQMFISETFTRQLQLNEYLLFDIDVNNLETPIQVRASFSHIHFIQDYYDQGGEDFYIQYQFHISRALFIEDTLYLISSGGITAYNILDLTTMLDDILLIS